MSQEYFNGEYKQLIRQLDKNIKYSGKVVLGSVLGLSFVALNYYFSNELGIETLNKSIKEMNNNEIINTALFGLTSFGTTGGIVLYGLFNFLKQDLKNTFKKEKKNNLEKKLENK